MALKVPIRIRGDRSKTGLEAERNFDVVEWYLLHNKTLSSLKLIIARALADKKITFVDWLVVKFISEAQARQEEVTISSLSLKFDFNVPQTTTLVKNLIKLNLIRHKVSKQDRRIKFLYCTRKGNRLVFDSNEVIQHSMRYWLFDLNNREIENYDNITRKINGFDIPPAKLD